MVSSMIYDNHKITMITMSDGSIYKLSDKYSRFSPYEEAGGTIWFAILNKIGDIDERINSAYVKSIHYGDTNEI